LTATDQDAYFSEVKINCNFWWLTGGSKNLKKFIGILSAVASKEQAKDLNTSKTCPRHFVEKYLLCHVELYSNAMGRKILSQDQSQRWVLLPSTMTHRDSSLHDDLSPPAPMNHVKIFKVRPRREAIFYWYTANTNHFKLTDSVRLK